MRVYEDHERPLGQCYDCGLEYGGPKWCDVLVPDDVWAKINPTRHRGAGLLCFNCIAGRLMELGLENVPIRVMSGPFELDWDRPFEPPAPGDPQE